MRQRTRKWSGLVFEAWRTAGFNAVLNGVPVRIGEIIATSPQNVLIRDHNGGVHTVPQLYFIVWQECDGVRQVSDIIKLLSRRSNGLQRLWAQTVIMILERLWESGLVDFREPLA